MANPTGFIRQLKGAKTCFRRVYNSATNSSGVLASYRFFFNQHHGIEANYGYSINTQSYTSLSGGIGVKSYSHEVSGA